MMPVYPVKLIRNPDNFDETIVERDPTRKFIPAPPFEPNTSPEIARYIRDWKCKSCGWIGKRDEMESDAQEMGDDEYWSNHICPQCKTWWQGLDEGYEIVIP